MSRAADLKANYKSKMIGHVDPLCPWHDSPLQLKKTKKGTEFMFCTFYSKTCPFTVWGGPSKAKLWSDLLKEKMSEDVAKGPLHCKCDERLRLQRCASEESKNFQRFFIACAKRRDEFPGGFFQWCDEPWQENLKQFFDWQAQKRNKRTASNDQEEDAFESLPTNDFSDPHTA